MPDPSAGTAILRVTIRGGSGSGNASARRFRPASFATIDGPVVHEPTSALEQVPAPIRRLDLWLTRVGGARNFCDGTELKAGLLGTGAQMEVHHIFPKAVLYTAGYAKHQVNALGNLCFLTAACNKWIGAACPAERSPYVIGKHDADLRRIGLEGYFAFVREKNPGALESQWIPMDEELWKVKNYPAFLEARRNLLAAAANLHLTTLYPGHAEVQDAVDGPLQVVPSASRPHFSGADEEEVLEELQDWMSGRGLPLGEFGYELRGDDTEEAEAIIDLACLAERAPGGPGATCCTPLERICGDIPDSQPGRIRLPHERRGVQALRGRRDRRGGRRHSRVTDSPIEPHALVNDLRRSRFLPARLTVGEGSLRVWGNSESILRRPSIIDPAIAIA